MPNVSKFAKALLALHQAGLMKDPDCKDPVMMFIRRATEIKLHHTTTNFRSSEAAKIIQSFAAERVTQGRPPMSESQFHSFCRAERKGNLRHEHMVPCEVIYQMIVNRPDAEISEDFLTATLRRYGIRATITREENAKLPATKMPKGFTDPTSDLYMNPLARYIEAGLVDSLEERRSETWLLSQ